LKNKKNQENDKKTKKKYSNKKIGSNSKIKWNKIFNGKIEKTK
jgi:hypothetical protein